MSRVWPFGLLSGVRVSNMLVSGLWLEVVVFFCFFFGFKGL